MKPTQKGLARFQTLAEAYGGDLERWPEHEQAWARDLAARSAEARAALAGEQGLDALFAAAEPPELPRSLAARLEQLPAELAPVRPLRLPRRAWRAPALGWAAAALIGLWLGTESARTDAVAEGSTESAENAEVTAPTSADAASDELADSSVLELASGSFDEWEDLQ